MAQAQKEEVMNFLADYLHFNSGNEANTNYHTWCALSALASLVSRKVWVDMGYFQVYPNLYTILVGPPGNKKTLAMDLAKDLVREVGGVPFSAECQTKEHLVKVLTECEVHLTPKEGAPPYIYTPLTIYATELSQFIGVDPARMLDFLVTVYDRKFYDSGTLKHGQQAIVGPYINLVGCTTPEWITNYLKTDIITGGFSRRCVFVLEDENDKRIALPVVTDDMRAAWRRCVERGQQLSQVFGEFTWDYETLQYYRKWYETRTISTNPSICAFDRTQFIQVLKVSMLLTLAQTNELRLHLAPLKASMELLNNILTSLPRVFAGMGRNELAQVSAKLEGQLLRAGTPMPEKELRHILWEVANYTDFTQVVGHLINTDRIVRFECATGGVKRWWLATPEQWKELSAKRKQTGTGPTPDSDGSGTILPG